MNDKIITAGVIGDPISHSLSPRLHGYWLKEYGIDGNYNAFHVTPEDLPTFVKTLGQNSISGINVTVPHKEHVMGFLDIVDDKAERIGAVNTIFRGEDGSLVGTNTDGYGYLMHLKSVATGWNAKNGPAVVLGAGGAARAVLVSLLDDGIPEIRLCNRTMSRAEKLADDLNDPRIKVVSWDDRETILDDCSLLTNVTTLGMTGQKPLEIELSNLPQSAVVYDIVYNPLETDLLRKARLNGNQTVDGLGMLLHQAAPGFEKWFGVMPDVDEGLRNHLLEAL